jgi:hypothetical protein
MFNNNFQNTNYNPNIDYDPYYAGSNQYYSAPNPSQAPTPYYQPSQTRQAFNQPYNVDNGSIPHAMAGNITEDVLYPYESTGGAPFLNIPVPSSDMSAGNYASGGRIRRFKRGGLLGSNPLKALKSVAGGGLGAIIGNMILPGVGGIVGGALGNAAGEAIRGRKNYGGAALKGAGIGAMLPSLAGIGGSLTGSLGMPQGSDFLTNYGNTNAVLPSLDNLLFGGASGGGGSPLSPISGVSAGDEAADSGFMDTLASKSKDFLTDPKNLLTTAVLGNALFNRPKAPKEKTPEQQADEYKRLQRGLMLSPDELTQQEKQLLAQEQMKRRVQRNKFLPEERFGNIDPIYAKSNTPEEHRRSGRWFNYYNNPGFQGSPLYMKQGGSARPQEYFGIEEDFVPQERGLGFLMNGFGGGQDDDVRINLPENSYIIDATTVSDLGDGNTRAGSRKLNALVSDGEMALNPLQVAAIGKRDMDKYVKRGTGALDNLVKNVRSHKQGGSTKLPPKAKPINAYMRNRHA